MYKIIRCFSNHSFYSLARPSNKIAIIDQCGRSFTYHQLQDDVNELRQRMKITPGSRVGILTGRSYSFLVSFLAILQSGAISVPLSDNHTLNELIHTCSDSGASGLVCRPQYRKLADLIVGSLPNIKVLEFDPSISKPKDKALIEKLGKVDCDDALLLYTSGTTGRPKGVLITRENIKAQIEGMQEAWKWDNSDHILHLLPLHHTHGLINCLLTPIFSGATCEFMHPVNSYSIWTRLMRTDRNLTLLMAVPTIYSKLIDAFDSMRIEKQKEAKQSCRQFRLMISGSSSLPKHIFDRWEEISGHRLLERYGMTEIGMALGNPLEGPRIPSFVGFPFPGVQVKLKSENEFAPGFASPGELLVKSNQIFKEYWNRPQETSDSFDKHGWFKTGDIAQKIDGKGYQILGRKSVDIIKSGGYKISALEIENEILDYPDILDVSVIGVPCPTLGEKVVAIISPKSSKTFDLEIFKEHLNTRLASYKQPRLYKVLDAIPRNALGKVNKKELVKYFDSCKRS